MYISAVETSIEKLDRIKKLFAEGNEIEIHRNTLYFNIDQFQFLGYMWKESQLHQYKMFCNNDNDGLNEIYNTIVGDFAKFKKIIKQSGFTKPIVCEENNSMINDKLIRLAAKITESYAGDIYYIIQYIDERIKNKCEFTLILNFREYGVDSFALPIYLDNGCRIGIVGSDESIQTWIVRGQFVKNDYDHCVFQTDLDRIILL